MSVEANALSRLPRGLVRSGFWLSLALLGVLALFVLGAQPFAVGIFPVPYDKLAHALVFGGLFLVLLRALVIPVWLAVAIPLLVSGADEFHQFFLPGRQPGLDDWFAGCAGVAVALLIRQLFRDA